MKNTGVIFGLIVGALSASIFIISCAGDSTKEESADQPETTSCPELDKLLDDAKCKSLVTSIKYELEGDLGASISSPSIMQNYSRLATGKEDPLNDGHKNIAIKSENNSFKFYVISGDGTSTEIADLSDRTVQVKMTSNKSIFDVQVYSQASPKWSNQERFSAGGKFDLKIVPDFKNTGSPAIVGMDDARDAANVNPNTPNTFEAITAIIDFVKWPNEKKVRIYYDTATSELVFSATGSTKFRTYAQLDPKKPGNVGEICWGMDWTDTVNTYCSAAK